MASDNMASEKMPNFQLSGDQEAALLLCSRQLDGDLTPEEQAQLSAYRQRPELAVVLDNFENSSRQISTLLQRLPMRTFGAQTLISSSQMVSQQTAPAFERTDTASNGLPSMRAAAGAVTLSAVPEQFIEADRRSGVRRTVAGIASLAALLLFLASNPWQAEHRTGDSSALPSLSANSSAGNGLAADGQTADWEPADSRVVAVPAQRSGAGEQILLDTAEVRILAVRVASSDTQAVRATIRAMVDRAGMHMAESSIVGSGTENGFGVLLTAAPASVQALVDDVSSSELVRSAEWDPLTVADMTPAELIAAVAKSMQSPTRSELHFGEVFLAFPARDNAHSELLAARDDRPAGHSASAQRSAKSTAERQPGRGHVPAAEGLPNGNSGADLVAEVPRAATGAAAPAIADRPAVAGRSAEERRHRALTEPKQAADVASPSGIALPATQQILVVFQFDQNFRVHDGAH